MATMIPDQPPAGEGGGKKAERALFSALRRGLPDDYFIYCNLRYLEGDRAREGEADFLVLHRTGGMLVIECKGKGVHCKDDGRWFRGTEPLTRTPEKQAQDQAKDLRKELERRMKKVSGLGWTRLPFAVGHALAFPRCHTIPSVWPLSLQPELLDGFLHNRRLTVAGGAGSGKTLMALEAAQRLAGQGRSVLVLCYNRALGSFLQGCAGAMDPGKGSVRARHFHGLCFDGWRTREGEQVNVPADREAAAAFWDDEAPMAVLEALEAGKLQRVDDVVVDEGQDFHASWWAVVDSVFYITRN